VITPSEIETLFPRVIEEMAADRGVDPLALHVETLDRVERGETTKEKVIREWVARKRERDAERRRREEQEKRLADDVALTEDKIRREKRTLDGMQAIGVLVQAFYDGRSRLPRDLKELAKQGTVHALDGWERELRYEQVKGGYARGYRLTSAGHDGQWGTEDDRVWETEVRTK
jgi:hypothetical protein